MPHPTSTPTSEQAVELLLRSLGRHTVISSVEQSAIRQLQPRVVAVGREEDIVCQGDRPDVAVMVLNGMLARYHTAQDGDRQYLSLHVAGDLPDLQSLFLGTMDHSLCALGEAKIACFRHQEILLLLQSTPSAAIPLWRYTLIDAAIFRQGITRNGTPNAVARVANLFCEQYTRARLVELVADGSCPFPLSQTQIGQVVGLSIATIHRATQTLRAENLAQVRAGRLHVTNWKKLCETAGFEPVYLHEDLFQK